MAHDHILELLERRSLKWLGKEICQYVSRWAIEDVNFFLVYSILHEEISNVNVPGISCARISAISLHSNGALIVLVHDILLEGITLVYHKVRHLYLEREIST